MVSGGRISGVVGGLGLGAGVVSGGALVGGESGAGTNGVVGICWRFWRRREGSRAKGAMGAASMVKRVARVASSNMEGPFIWRLGLLGY